MSKKHDECDKRTGCSYFIPYPPAAGDCVQDENRERQIDQKSQRNDDIHGITPSVLPSATLERPRDGVLDKLLAVPVG